MKIAEIVSFSFHIKYFDTLLTMIVKLLQSFLNVGHFQSAVNCQSSYCNWLTSHKRAGPKADQKLGLQIFCRSGSSPKVFDPTASNANQNH
jgi:hypothetical protein